MAAGQGSGRRRLTIVLDGEDQAVAESEPTSQTFITARVPMERETAKALLENVCEEAALLPCRLVVGGELLPRFNPRAPGTFFETGAVRGWIGLPPWIGRPSRLHLSYLGVGAGVREVALPFGAVEAWLNDDRAAVDLSGFVGTSERWKRLLRLVELETLRFILKIAESQPARMRRAWKVLSTDPAARDAWRRREEWGPKGAPDGLAFAETLAAAIRGGDARRLRLRQTLWTLHVTLWLRELALAGRAAPAGTPVRVVRALAEAPVFFGTDGGLWSLERLKKRADERWIRQMNTATRGLDRLAEPLWRPSRRDYAWLKAAVW